MVGWDNSHYAVVSVTGWGIIICIVVAVAASVRKWKMHFRPFLGRWVLMATELPSRSNEHLS